MADLEKCGIFSGNGELYDRLRGPHDPIRIGTILYAVIESLPALEDTPVLTDTMSNE